jgi:transposase-like protein
MPELRIQIAQAIAQLGVAEVSRRLGLDDESTLRLAVPGAKVRNGTIALASANAHRLASEAAHTS